MIIPTHPHEYAWACMDVHVSPDMKVCAHSQRHTHLIQRQKTGVQKRNCSLLLLTGFTVENESAGLESTSRRFRMWHREIQGEIACCVVCACVCVQSEGTYWDEKFLDLLQSVTHPCVGLRRWGKHLDEDVQVLVQVLVLCLAALPQLLLLMERGESCFVARVIHLRKENERTVTARNIYCFVLQQRFTAGNFSITVNIMSCDVSVLQTYKPADKILMCVVDFCKEAVLNILSIAAVTTNWWLLSTLSCHSTQQIKLSTHLHSLLHHCCIWAHVCSCVK